MEYVVPALLGVLFLTFLLAKLLGLAAVRLGVPSMVGEIIAGIVIANVAIGSFSLVNFLDLTPTGNGSLDVVEALAELGLVFLVFYVGLKIRPTDLLELGRPASKIALFGAIVPFLIGVGFFLAVEGVGNYLAALFVGVALVATSVGIVAHVLESHALLEGRQGRLILTAAVIEDIVAFVALAILLGIAKGQGSIDLSYQVGLVIVMALGLVAVTIYVTGPIVRRYFSQDPSGAAEPKWRPSGPFIIALLLCLGAGALAESFALAAIVGAFLAGIGMAEVAPRYGVARSFAALNEFLVPFFFLYIGLQISGTDLLAVWPLALAITAIAIAAKIAAGALDAKEHGREDGFAIGTAMVARGEVGVIIAVSAYQVGALDPDYYTAIVVMAILTAIIGPWMFGELQRRRWTPHPGWRMSATPAPNGPGPARSQPPPQA
jgi:Kef-type K+ transport system membrane component KefB